MMKSTNKITRAMTKILPGPKPKLKTTKIVRPKTPLKSKNDIKIMNLIISPPFPCLPLQVVWGKLKRRWRCLFYIAINIFRSDNMVEVFALLCIIYFKIFINHNIILYNVLIASDLLSKNPPDYKIMTNNIELYYAPVIKAKAYQLW